MDKEEKNIISKKFHISWRDRKLDRFCCGERNKNNHVTDSPIQIENSTHDQNNGPPNATRHDSNMFVNVCVCVCNKTNKQTKQNK